MAVAFAITVYNKAPFLPNVLAAVAAERESVDGEIVIVDDGSTDDSPVLLDRFAARHRDVRVLHQPNQGVAAATNRVLRATTLPFVRLIDGDDIIARHSTTRLLQVLASTDSGFAFGGCAGYVPDTATADLPEVPPDVRFRVVRDPLYEAIRMTLFVPSATLGRREVYEGILPLSERYRTSQDYSLALRIARATRVVQLEPICCYMPKSAPGRLSSSKARMFQDATCISRDLMDEWPRRYRAAAVRRSAGRAYHYARRHLPGTGWRCASLAAIKIASYVPLTVGRLHGPLMDWIAETYAPAVARPSEFP